MPAQLHLAWDAPGATLRVAIPPAFADASAAGALQLRLAVDPLDRRSPAAETQRIRVILRDRDGGEAAQVVAVAFPLGTVVRESWFGHVFSGMVRLPLASFSGIALSRLAAVELRPEYPSGAIFLAALELVADGGPIGGPQLPSPFRSLSGAASVPELSVVPAGGALSVLEAFLIELGLMMLSSGDIVSRTTARLHRIAAVYGAKDAHIIVLPTGLWIQIADGAATHLAERPLRGTGLRLDEVQELGHALACGQVGDCFQVDVRALHTEGACQTSAGLAKKVVLRAECVGHRAPGKVLRAED